MRTVKWLREELAKFPDEALVYAYEGEATGLSISLPNGKPGANGRPSEYGFIHCSGWWDSEKDPPTELIGEGAPFASADQAIAGFATLKAAMDQPSASDDEPSAPAP